METEKQPAPTDYRAQRDALAELLREAVVLMPLGTAKRAKWLTRVYKALKP